MTQVERRTSEWRDGWTLVLASSVGFSFFSIMLSSTGLFMEPLTKAFGWSRSVLSAGVSVATITTAVLSPFVGVLIDRYGSRRLVLPGTILTIAAISAFALLNGSVVQWMVLWLLFGVASVSIKSTAWTASVLGVFRRSRGMALGLTLAGTAVAQTAVPPLGNYLITAFGWRAAFVLIAVGWGAITFVLAWRWFYDAHDQRPDPAKLTDAEKEPAPALTGLSRQEAMRDSALWRVGISNFVVMALTMGLGVHLFPILTEAGVPRTQAAWMMSLMGLAGIAGKLVTGHLLDRFRPNWIGGVTLGACALAFLLLMYGIHSPALILVALIINGYAAGTKTQITGFLTASYGGMRNFGVIYGVMAALMALASGMGPLLAGRIYDLSGGYAPFLIAGAAGCVLGGIMMISLPRYPAWERGGAGA